MPNWEEINEVYKLHNEKIKEFGNLRGQGWTLQDTANIFSIGQSTVCEYLKMAKALEDGKVDISMPYERALTIASEESKKLRFQTFSVKYKDKNALYLREDLGIPYLFATTKGAKDFCNAIKDSNGYRLEPVRLKFTTVKVEED